MFCNKCGYKLKTDSKVCDHCGEPVSDMDVCGGFLGLVNEEKLKDKNIDEKTSYKKQDSVEQSQFNNADNKRINKYLAVICVLLGAFIGINVYSVIQFTKILAQQEEGWILLEEELSYLEKNIQQLGTELDELIVLDNEIKEYVSEIGMIYELIEKEISEREKERKRIELLEEESKKEKQTIYETMEEETTLSGEEQKIVR